MKILITGNCLSMHHKIAALLAGRMDLDYISAHDLVDGFCESLGITIEQFNAHSDASIDKQFNDCLKAKVAESENYVCDCYGITQLGFEGLKIYLHREIFEEVGDTSDNYTRLAMSKHVMQSIYNKDTTCMTLYDLYLVTNGKDPDYVVDWLVNAIVSGNYINRGLYIPAYMCIPMTAELPVSNDAYYKRRTTYSILKFLSAYLLSGDFTQAVLNAEHNDLLYVPFENYTQTIARPKELKPVAFYDTWLKQTGDTKGLALLSMMLANYCYTLESFNYDLAYTNFTVNGNPVKRLIELGFHN